jgi:transcriptional regulator GlxA family with amidase domain
MIRTMRRPANDTVAIVKGANGLDERIARAVAAMECAPHARWSVTALARVCGMSRAVFARRFTAELGVPPLRWLAGVRLGLAVKLLMETNVTLAEIADSVGYATAFALSKAFKRTMGVPPAVFRELTRMRSSAPTFRAAA